LPGGELPDLRGACSLPDEQRPGFLGQARTARDRAVLDDVVGIVLSVLERGRRGLGVRGRRRGEGMRNETA
jgi:hypothetical protein